MSTSILRFFLFKTREVNMSVCDICILPLGIRPLHISHSTCTLFVPTKFGMSVDLLLSLGTAKILSRYLVTNFWGGRGGGWGEGANKVYYGRCKNGKFPS